MKTEKQLREELLRMQYRGKQYQFTGSQLKRFNNDFVNKTIERHNQEKLEREQAGEREVKRRIVENLQPVFRKHGIK